MSSECPQGVPAVSPSAMDPREVLKGQVEVVATLGKLAAIVTAPHSDAWPLLYQRSLREDLREFVCSLRDTLRQHGVAYLGQYSYTSLGQALDILSFSSWTNCCDARAAARDWRNSVDMLEDRWFWLVEKAADLLDDWEDAAKATSKATTEATTTGLAGDVMDETAGGGTAGDSLVAVTQQLPVALAKKKAALLVAAHEARVAAATKAMEEAVVATSQAGAATRRGQWAKVARGLLGRLVVVCDRASLLPLELHKQLADIEAAMERTREVTSKVLKGWGAAVAQSEQLWEASIRLTTDHLLETLEEINSLLSHPCHSSGGPGGLFGHAVAERCQKAIEDIPRLLGGQ